MHWFFLLWGTALLVVKTWGNRRESPARLQPLGSATFRTHSRTEVVFLVILKAIQVAFPVIEFLQLITGQCLGLGQVAWMACSRRNEGTRA